MLFEITKDGNGFISTNNDKTKVCIINTENIQKEENKPKAYLEFLQIFLKTLQEAGQNSKVLTPQEKNEVAKTLEHINSKIKEKSKTLCK